MNLKMRFAIVLSAVLLSQVLAVTISETNGNRFISASQGKSVSNVEGLVTAKSPSRLYLRSITADSDNRASEAIYVYGSDVAQVGRNIFFTVNVNFTRKGGGLSIEGDARPPVNGGVEKRLS